MRANFPAVTDFNAIPTGDMPGDKVQITDDHVAKAQAIFPPLWESLQPLLADSPHHRAVVAVHGGSGVGKSETGSLLAYGLNALGVGAYVLSGDNYPRRVPSANDAERLRVFRAGGLQGLVAAGSYDPTVRAALADLQASDRDADATFVATHPWLTTYQKAGRKALAGYLGTPAEVDFAEISRILAAFHDGAGSLMLKRMGRTPDALWYDEVDVTDTQVIVVEWTHGNNDYLTGVDIPILLNSTPEETLAHRRARSRDGAVDSPFTTVVLELEQAKLRSQARKALIIVAKGGGLLEYDEYLKAMGADLPAAGPMLNVYPDSIGGTLSDLVDFVRRPELKDVFSSAYLLPSIFNTDLDRGFSVIDYNLSDRFTTPDDLPALAEEGIDFKFDFILNHASVLSPQFQDILAKGDIDSPVYTFLPDLSPPLAESTSAKTAARGSASFSLDKTTAGLMLMARQLGAPVADVPIVEDEPVAPSAKVNLDQAQAKLMTGDFSAACGFLQEVRKQRPNDSFVIQQLALATYKSRLPNPEAALNEARKILLELNPARTNDPETLGLWGAVYKRLWEITRLDRDLNESIEAYARGFHLKQDYYNGINLAFLLELRALAALKAGERDEGITDSILAKRTRQEVIKYAEPLIDKDFGVERRYWILATLWEATAGLGNTAAAESWAAQARALKPAGWMTDSTQTQIQNILTMQAEIARMLSHGSTTPP